MFSRYVTLLRKKAKFILHVFKKLLLKVSLTKGNGTIFLRRVYTEFVEV